jgi:lipopolysaccharide assembly outer membrane protein LptD (OstA)
MPRENSKGQIMKTRPRLQWILMAGLLTGLAVNRAAAEPAAKSGPQHLEFTADRLEYGLGTGWVELWGNVTVTCGDERLHADAVRVNRDTKDAEARGHVRLIRPAGEWTGETLTYNFETGEGTAAGVAGRFEPFVMEWQTAERRRGDTNVMHDVKVTTCNREQNHWHYHVRAASTTMVPGDYLKARHAVFYLGPVPVFYLPYWYRDLDGLVGYRVYPGYDSRMGAFLLSSVRYPLNTALRGETHVDYRSLRGVALGQDVRWREGDRYAGMLSLYGLDDQNPVDDDEDAETADIESGRYRVFLDHRQDFNARDYMLMQLEYVSDTDLREDFFEDEYREQRQPENYFVFTHRGDEYTAGLAVRSRVNDFFEAVNRIPELSLDLFSRPLGSSGIYYESRTTASGLKRVFPEESDNEEYSTFRLDTDHRVNRPSKHFGFLTLVPRLGYRGTYYSKTRETGTNTVTFASVVTNTTVIGGITNTSVTTAEETAMVEETIEADGELRSLVELGVEASFKAFRVFGPAMNPRRHVVEPYANYTFIPEPTLLPDRIYAFDSVDTLKEKHVLKLGVRNKLQIKRKGRPFDLLDVDLFTRLRLERETGEDVLGPVEMDAELRPTDWLALDVDALYSPELSSLQAFNAWIRVHDLGPWTASVDYRFLQDESSLLAGDVTVDINTAWACGLSGRYEFEESRLEETGCFVQRTLDCMAIKMGVSFMPGYERSDGTEREDDVRALVELWLTAFPHVSLAAGHKN